MNLNPYFSLLCLCVKLHNLYIYGKSIFLLPFFVWVYWNKLKDLIWGTDADNTKKQAVAGTHLVIKTAFPSPTAAEMAEISQI